MNRFELVLIAGLIAGVPFAAAEDKAEVKARAKAVRQLAKGGSTSIPQIEGYVVDEAPEVRLEATRALSEIGTQYSLDPLVKATADDDAQVQIQATLGLTNFYLPGYLQSGTQRFGTSVKGKFTDTNTQIIPAYVTVRPDVVVGIARLVNGGANMESRATAARASGVLRARLAVPELSTALRSKDDNVMFESLIALQKIGDKSAGPAVSVYVRDLNERVRLAAIETVGLLKYDDGVPALEQLFRESDSDKVRRASLSAIAMLAQPKSHPLFVASLADKDEGVRAAAAEGIGRLKNVSTLPMVTKLFDEERKMPPRLAQAFAIVSLGKTELTEFSALQYLLNTLNSAAYHGVAEAYLIELARDANIREQLYASLEKANKDEKRGIIRVLAVSGDKRSIEKIEPLTRDSDADVAEESIRAVRVLRSRIM